MEDFVTFSSKVKLELCNKVQNKSSSSYSKAELYGLLLFAKKSNADTFLFTAENENVCKRVSYLIYKEFKVSINITSFKNVQKNKFVISIPIKIYKKITSYKLENVKQKTKNVIAILKGAFLSVGTITDPNVDYHLEWCTQNKVLAEYIKELILSISKLKINVGITKRKSAYVVYIKGSENISDILTLLGAPICAMEIIQIKMVKEVRNNINRITNFEAANISKTAVASAKQVYAIEKIKKEKTFNELPDDLQEVANLRLLNPDMSLRDLGKILSKPLSRSGVNHRFKKILELAFKK